MEIIGLSVSSSVKKKRAYFVWCYERKERRLMAGALLTIKIFTIIFVFLERNAFLFWEEGFVWVLKK